MWLAPQGEKQLIEGKEFSSFSLRGRHLRQMLILRLLAYEMQHCGKKVFRKKRQRSPGTLEGAGFVNMDMPGGLTLEGILARIPGAEELWGKGEQGRNLLGEDLKELLQAEMVQFIQEGSSPRRWYLADSHMPPLYLTRVQLERIYEGLTHLPAHLPIAREQLERLRKKFELQLRPQGSEEETNCEGGAEETAAWRQRMVKLALREVVHGYYPAGGEQRFLELFQKAAASRQAVEIIYRGKKKRIFPLTVIYHWRKGEWYVAAASRRRACFPEIYRLDRVEQAEACATSEAYPGILAEKMLRVLEQSWGISCDQVVEVKIRVTNTPWDTTAAERFKYEVQPRKRWVSSCKLIEENADSVVLCDVIAGVSEFLAWLRSYGDAVEIISPSWLRDRYCESARRLLDIYGGRGDK